MDHTFHESLKPSCPPKYLLEPEKLLEHLWFFSNILLEAQTNVIMSGIIPNEKLPDESWPSNLIRAPLPPRAERKDQNQVITNDHPKNDECQDEESEFSMGKLIRQASLGNSESFPPRGHVVANNKGLTTSSRISRHGSITKVELDKLKGLKRAQRTMKPLKTQKSLNDLVLYQELQGFKDFGLDSESSSSSCQAQTSDRRPGGKKPAEEDIKAQIKYWARAVASNVRQES